MKARDYLDLLKEKQCLTSDNAAAIWLGISPPAVYKIRRGGGMEVSTALKVAKGIGMKPDKVVFDLMIEKSKDSSAEKFWRDQLGKVASALLLVPVFTSTIISTWECILCKIAYRRTFVSENHLLHKHTSLT